MNLAAKDQIQLLPSSWYFNKLKQTIKPMPSPESTVPILDFSNFWIATLTQNPVCNNLVSRIWGPYAIIIAKLQ